MKIEQNNQIYIGQCEKLSTAEWMYLVVAVELTNVFIVINDENVPFFQYAKVAHLDLQLPDRDGYISPLGKLFK